MNDEHRQRVLSRVPSLPGDQCWPWQGTLLKPYNYGQISLGGKKWAAHRAVWVALGLKIPEGLFLLHSCDNPPCVNPAHLRVGTQQDNIRDCVERGRFVSGPALRPEAMRRGVEHPAAKLTDDEVRAIRRKRAGGEHYRSLAAEFGVSKSLVFAICSGKIWRHLLTDFAPTP